MTCKSTTADHENFTLRLIVGFGGKQNEFTNDTLKKARSKMSRNKSKTRSTSPELRSVITRKAKPVDTNVFASPWKKSDVVLLVEGQEFHVHRAILVMQSPVFEAMLDGHFREASQKVITLKEKTSEDMLQFLKLLYPVNMIKKPLIPFDDKNILKILLLADEYQAEDVMRYLLKKIIITKNNVLKLIPYATKYDAELRKKCIRVVSSEMRMNMLEKKIPEVEVEQPELVKELLIAKCRHLEQFDKKNVAPKTMEDFHFSSDYCSSCSSSPLQ